MRKLLSKLFGKGAALTAAAALEHVAPASREQKGRREPPAELDWSGAEYIPLPPSPATWEVDGRNEFHEAYNDPTLRPVFQAGFKRQHTKVVKLAATLSAEQREGQAGEVIARAYRKLIVQRQKAGQLAAAAKQSLEMFGSVPAHVQDVDKRRYNRILADLNKSGKKHDFEPVAAAAPSDEPLFQLSQGASWSLEDQRKLEATERPDPAFDVVAFGEEGTWLLDPTGKSAKTPGVAAVLRRVDRDGHLVAQKALPHDAYRTSSASQGSCFGILDSGGVLHIYDAALELVVESDLQADHRVTEHFRTIDTNYWGEFKSQVRAVDVSPQGDRYLFTLADEAWCCALNGSTQWGVVMPLKDGWKRVVGRSERVGVAREVEDALRLFGLALPVDPADIKPRYYALTRAHHPDRNPGDSTAVEKMKAINAAFEVLTGIDPNTLVLEESDRTYFARTGPDHVFEVEGLRFEINLPREPPQDWIYSAAFAAKDGGTFLATYSGKVILLSREGKAQRVYDIGTCPHQIVDTARYTYFLTATRLYVVEDGRKLAAFLDVFRQGRLIVGQSGFGLLTGKRLQCFMPGGTKVGELVSRDPIRTVYSVDDGVVVETRRDRVMVRGLRI